jgi:hypothetical protein
MGVEIGHSYVSRDGDSTRMAVDQFRETRNFVLGRDGKQRWIQVVFEDYSAFDDRWRSIKGRQGGAGPIAVESGSRMGRASRLGGRWPIKNI